MATRVARPASLAAQTSAPDSQGSGQYQLYDCHGAGLPTRGSCRATLVRVLKVLPSPAATGSYDGLPQYPCELRTLTIARWLLPPVIRSGRHVPPNRVRRAWNNDTATILADRAFEGAREATSLIKTSVVTGLCSLDEEVLGVGRKGVSFTGDFLVGKMREALIVDGKQKILVGATSSRVPKVF